MANPFVATFDSTCDGCGGFLMEDDSKVYAHDGEYYCENCASDMKIACPECGRFKKPEYETCFKCRPESGDGATLESWN